MAAPLRAPGRRPPILDANVGGNGVCRGGRAGPCIPNPASRWRRSVVSSVWRFASWICRSSTDCIPRAERITFSCSKATFWSARAWLSAAIVKFLKSAVPMRALADKKRNDSATACIRAWVFFSPLPVFTDSRAKSRKGARALRMSSPSFPTPGAVMSIALIDFIRVSSCPTARRTLLRRSSPVTRRAMSTPYSATGRH